MARLLFSIILACLVCTGARADLLPPAGYREQQAANLIAGAGYVCPSVTRLEAPVQPRGAALEARGYDAQTAICNNGRRFLLGWYLRRRLFVPNGAPPRPAPVVEPLP
jgi:hypothetical protein